MSRTTTHEEEVDLSLNDILVRGRLTGLAQEKELPSGDKVSEFRIVVTRPDRDGVDTLDIAAWSSVLRRKSLSLKRDEWIEVQGSIRRRFWKGPHGLASRWQIEAHQITRL